MIEVKWEIYGEGHKTKTFTRSPYKNNAILCLEWSLKHLRKKGIDFTITDGSLKTNRNIVHPDYRAELARQLREGKKHIKETSDLWRDPNDGLGNLLKKLTLHFHGADELRAQMELLQCLGYPPDDLKKTKEGE